MKRLVIKGARVLDPSTGLDGLLDIIAMGGRVASIRPPDRANTYEGDQWEVVEAAGLLVVPGLIDIHTHLRVPISAALTGLARMSLYAARRL